MGGAGAGAVGTGAGVGVVGAQCPVFEGPGVVVFEAVGAQSWCWGGGGPILNLWGGGAGAGDGVVGSGVGVGVVGTGGDGVAHFSQIVVPKRFTWLHDAHFQRGYVWPRVCMKDCRNESEKLLFDVQPSGATLNFGIHTSEMY
ncbi:hypothetical protein CYMTET_39783 [Cymbomonas tetramitiformis]|uniref:Uncharacterized protein n=1 Tax=Cymbomonas tetramitiformis TaxID=36881 RepID=A0AAE0CBF8_9CHLO|nr:hypothetical protein CYMTET_39783 [Cymbomonas tetramitiformis]